MISDRAVIYTKKSALLEDEHDYIEMILTAHNEK